jgi:hypothetical protein
MEEDYLVIVAFCCPILNYLVTVSGELGKMLDLISLSDD